MAKKSTETQQFFDGLEPPRIKALDKLALDFKEKRDAWQSAHEPMMEAKDKLLEAVAANVYHAGTDDDPAKKLHPNENGEVVYPIPGTDQEIVYRGERIKEPDVKVRTRKPDSAE